MEKNMNLYISNKDLLDNLLTKNPNEIESYQLVQNFIKRIQEGTINFDFDFKKSEIIRCFCNNAECYHEIYWANKIINSQNPKDEIKKFPSFKYYEKLISLEMRSINYFSNNKKIKAVFVGGGAMPMSSILLAEKYNISSVVLEMDSEVSEISKKLIDSLGLSRNIKILSSSGESFNYKGFDLIIIAVMAGFDLKTKELILERIKNTADKKILILARSSYGRIKYIYQSLPKNIFSEFNLILYVKPYREVQVSHYIFEN